MELVTIKGEAQGPNVIRCPKCNMGYRVGDDSIFSKRPGDICGHWVGPTKTPCLGRLPGERPKLKKKANTRVGMFFHTFNEDGQLHWQGKVIGRVSSERIKVIPVSDMESWAFYISNDAMLDAYPRVTQR